VSAQSFSTRSFAGESSPALLKKRYDQMTPEERVAAGFVRPATDAEIAAAQSSQTQGAPADFAWPVLPNPNNIKVSDDTDSGVEPTRLPNGVSFQKQNFTGATPGDVSNPPHTQMSTTSDWFDQNAPKASSADWFDQNAPAQTAKPQPSVMQVLTQPTEKTDKEYLGYTGPAGVAGATIHGLNDVAQGTKDAIKGAYDSVAQPPQDKTETAVSALGPGALPIYRMLRGLGHSAADATHVAAAIHDINQSPDPTGAYANVAEQTAAQGAGQALTAIGTEGVGKAASAVADISPTKLTAPVRAAVKAMNTALAKAPGTVGGTIGGSVGGYFGGHAGAELGTLAGGFAGNELLPKIKIPGEHFGLPDTVEGGPRTIVQDPTTGKPEFSDVVAAKQNAAQASPAAAPEKNLDQALNDSLGGKPLVRGVSLRNQPAAQAVAAGKLPQGFTPVDSSVLKGYKYDPDAQEFTAITNNGQSYTHGEVTPDQVAAFENADSQGSAWTKFIRNNNVLVKKNGVPVTPGTMGSESGNIMPKSRSGMNEPETETYSQPLQQMLDEALQDKNTAPTGKSGSILNRLVKGEAGQAGSPGSVTDADEGIADIQSRPVLATKTGQVPARGYLNMVGADENSVLKTPADLDSVFYHRQQIAQNGTPNVELHVDEAGNIIGAQGRHRAIAAIQQGGPSSEVNVTIYKHPFQTSE
jgi:hypothetical protein